MAKYGNARIVPRGFIGMVNEPYVIERVCQDAARELIDKVIVEARKGECTIKLTEEQFDRPDQDTIELRETIEIHPLVRCKDCKYWDRLEPGHPYGYCYAAKHGYMSSNWDISIYRKQKEDFYCADGERKDAENEV